jgi:hypothetical protein
MRHQLRKLKKLAVDYFDLLLYFITIELSSEENLIKEERRKFYGGQEEKGYRDGFYHFYFSIADGGEGHCG